MNYKAKVTRDRLDELPILFHNKPERRKRRKNEEQKNIISREQNEFFW